MAKKPFSFFTPKTNQQKADDAMGRAQIAGKNMASKGNYKSPKTNFQQARDDVLMDLGIKTKDIDYYARLDDRVERTKQATEDMKERRRRKNRRKQKGETAAEREARLKREALARERAEGQKKRKKFYKEKGERLAKLKAKLLNLT